MAGREPITFSWYARMMQARPRVGVSPGTTAFVIGQTLEAQGLGRLLNPGMVPRTPCPPDPPLVFQTDPWTTQGSPTNLMPVMPTPAAPQVPTAGSRIVRVQAPYGTDSSLKGPFDPPVDPSVRTRISFLSGAPTSPFGVKWSTVGIVLGAMFVGGFGLAFALKRR